jgi:hypothetical protein
MCLAFAQHRRQAAEISDALTGRESYLEEEKPHSASYLFFQGNARIAELLCSPEGFEKARPERVEADKRATA